MFARARDRDLVEHAEEIEVQRFCEGLGRALLRWKVTPSGKGTLRTTEHVLNVARETKTLRQSLRVALIRKGELVAQVAEPVVDRCGGKHKNLRLYAFADDLFQ